MMKKSFCDGWDNLLSMLIANLICMVGCLGVFYLFTFASKAQSDILLSAVLLVGVIYISIMVFAYGECCASIANFESVRIVDFFKAIPGCIKDGLLFGIMIFAVAFISFYGISFYWSDAFLTQKPLLGIFLGALQIWIDVFFILSIQWFIPIRSLMHNKFFKCLKKSFIMFLDNTGFSIGFFIYNLVLTAISVFFIGLLPSFCGIQIARTNAVRLRLYKYDYLEEHPELQSKRQRKKIPWEELIYEDKETLGPRKLKSFLFPWKE